MWLLIIGLVLFLGIHSARIFAENRRTQFIAARGDNAWKGIYSLVSLVGFVLLIYGYGIARQQPVVIWTPPAGMRHAAILLTWIAFIFLVAAYIPKNQIKAAVHHPMVLSVKVWALAHLLANGTLHDIVLFGGFLIWAVACFAASRKRDRRLGTQYPTGGLAGSLMTIAVGSAVWASFAIWLHLWLIGVKPFG